MAPKAKATATAPAAAPAVAAPAAPKAKVAYGTAAAPQFNGAALVQVTKGATTNYLKRQAGQRYTIHQWLLANGNGQTVAAVLAAIRPLKGGLGDLRIAIGAGAITVQGHAQATYAVRKGTAQLPVAATAAPAA